MEKTDASRPGKTVRKGSRVVITKTIDGRDVTHRDKWSELLFWGKFVGSDASHKIINPGCGWAHYPPNGERDYDWANPRYVMTDIEDWQRWIYF